MITARQFIIVWQESETLGDVVKKLGTTHAYASSRASKLRAKGIPLKYFRVARHDWGEMAKLAIRADEE